MSSSLTVGSFLERDNRFEPVVQFFQFFGGFKVTLVLVSDSHELQMGL